MVEAGEFGGPPNGYHPMPEGHRCRCPKLWTDGKGNHWCCRPLAASPAPALPESGVDRVLKLYREAVRIDVQMEGSKFMGCDSSALKRAWDADRAALATPASAPAPADVMLGVMAALAAAISLLERTPRAKKAAPSDAMFEQMLADYRQVLARARSVTQEQTDV